MPYYYRTARLDKFSHFALKLNTGFAELSIFFRFALFDGEIYPFEAISKGSTDTSLVVLSVIKYSYLFIFRVFAFWIFVSNGTVCSKILIL